MSDLKTLMGCQKKFSNLFFHPKSMSLFDKEEKHKTFCLALHSEVSSLADAISYKDHRWEDNDPDRQKIIYELVDILRYFLGTANLWEISPEELMDAFVARDVHLWSKHQKTLSSWKGQPVVVVDVDDVIAEFRHCYFDWMNKTFSLSLSEEHHEYYFKGNVGSLTNEQVFTKFIEESGLRTLSINQGVVDALHKLKKDGFWIQLLSARPSSNIKCINDTYFWLNKCGIPYDNIAFSPEKYLWLDASPFDIQKDVVCAIDDSAKNAAEYAQHDILVYVPERSYNQSVKGHNLIKMFDWKNDDLYEIMKEILETRSSI